MIPDFELDEVWPENEKKPYRVLPNGIHPCEYDELQKRFVDEFAHSQTRADILNGFTKLSGEALACQVSFSHWVCGSFVTTKLDPGDVEICTFGAVEPLGKLHVDTRQKLLQLFDGKEATKAKYHSHAFFIPVYPVGHRGHQLSKNMAAKWQKWFGHTRPLLDPQQPTSDVRLPKAPKGIVRVITGDKAEAPEDSQLLT